MSALVAAVVVVGLLGLVNLLFLFGVIRRLRQNTETIETLRNLSSGRAAMGPMPEAGSTVEDFTTKTVDGEEVTRDGLDGTTLVGIFSPDCFVCEERVEPFLAYATTHPGGRSRTLVVVVGTVDAAVGYIERLAPTTRVVVEPQGGPLCRALGVRGYPAFALIDDDQVRVSGSNPDELPVAVG